MLCSVLICGLVDQVERNDAPTAVSVAEAVDGRQLSRLLSTPSEDCLQCVGCEACNLSPCLLSAIDDVSCLLTLMLPFLSLVCCFASTPPETGQSVLFQQHPL